MVVASIGEVDVEEKTEYLGLGRLEGKISELLNEYSLTVRNDICVGMDAGISYIVFTTISHGRGTFALNVCWADLVFYGIFVVARYWLPRIYVD